MICCLLFKELPGWHVNTEEWGIASCIGLRTVKPEIFAVGWWFSTDRDILQATHVASCRINLDREVCPLQLNQSSSLSTYTCISLCECCSTLQLATWRIGIKYHHRLFFLWGASAGAQRGSGKQFEVHSQRWNPDELSTRSSLAFAPPYPQLSSCNYLA